MRITMLLVIVLFAAGPAVGQPETDLDTSAVSRIQYTRLDQLEKDRARIFGGERASIRFNFIRLKNLTTEQTLRGVEINITRRDQKRVGGSIALAAVGSMFGVSSSVTYRRIQESGYIFLRPTDMGEVVSFLNQVVGNLGREQEQYQVWKISIQEGFELGIKYDPDQAIADRVRESARDRPAWKFIVSASDATYQLDYEDGMEIIRTLSEWRNRIQE